MRPVEQRQRDEHEEVQPDDGLPEERRQLRVAQRHPSERTARAKTTRCTGTRKAATTPPPEKRIHQNGSLDLAMAQLLTTIQYRRNSDTTTHAANAPATISPGGTRWSPRRTTWTTPVSMNQVTVW